MDQNILQSALMGFVSGLCEPLPLSADAHRGLLRSFFGIHAEDALFLLLSHIAALLVILMCGRTELGRLHRANRMLRTAPKRRQHNPDLASVNTIRLLRRAGVLAVIGRILAVQLQSLADSTALLCIPLILGGIVLWIPSLLRTANRDGRHMLPLDGTLMGLGALACAVPGLSLVGVSMSIGSARGVQRRYALRFAWLLLLISLCTAIVTDLVTLAGTGFDFEWMQILCAVAGGVFCAVGAYLAVHIMLALTRPGAGGIGGFCYYSWGQALLCFVLFLLV